MLDLAPIKARAEAATKGPWCWRGYVPAPEGHGKHREIRLVTVSQGGLHVMGFERWGMGGARPRFRDHARCLMLPLEQTVKVKAHSGEITGPDHPDMAFLAAARQDADDLIAEVERLRDEVETLQAAIDGAAEALIGDGAGEFSPWSIGDELAPHCHKGYLRDLPTTPLPAKGPAKRAADPAFNEPKPSSP